MFLCICELLYEIPLGLFSFDCHLGTAPLFGERKTSDCFILFENVFRCQVKSSHLYFLIMRKCSKLAMLGFTVRLLQPRPPRKISCKLANENLPSEQWIFTKLTMYDKFIHYRSATKFKLRLFCSFTTRTLLANL